MKAGVLAEILEDAVARHRRGELAAAAALYREVLETQPRNFAALYNLGVACLQQGELGAAHRVFAQALDERPDSADSHHGLGLALGRSGKPVEAAAAFERALGLHPRHEGARGSLAMTLLGLERPAEAIVHFEEVLRTAPDNAVAAGGLGLALAALRRHGEAIALFRRALAINPGSEAVHNDLGISLHAINRPREALLSYERAIALEPDFAVAHHNRGTVLEELGRLDDARRAFETAVTLAPRQARHYRSLASHHRFEPGDPHLARMEALARDPSALAADERIELSFALAKALADVRRHDESFRHLAAGNALKRARIGYDERATLAGFERIGALFTPERMRRGAGGGDPTPVPVFIVGMPRSGTTLVEQILASHPAVFGAGELPDFQSRIERLTGEPAGSVAFATAAADLCAPALARLGAEYGAGVAALAPAARRIVDKTTANFRFLGLIHLALPNARILHLRRDSIDTGFSCFSQLFSEGQAHTYDLAELGRYSAAYAALMTHWRGVLPAGVMLEVRYEAVVADLEREARRILAHCGLDWDRACLRFEGTRRPVRTASAVQVRRPIYNSSIGRWRPYREWLRPLFDALGLDPAATR